MVSSTAEEVFFPAGQERQQGRGCAAQGTSGAEGELCCLGTDESGAKVKWVLFVLRVWAGKIQPLTQRSGHGALSETFLARPDSAFL